MTLDKNEEIRELLTSTNGCDTLESTKACVTRVLTHAKRYQERVRKHIDDNYVDFMPNHSASDMYIEEGEALLKEAEDVLRTVGGDTRTMLNEANAELNICLTELNEIFLGLRLSQRLLKIDDLFQCIEEANSTKEYLIVLDYIDKLKSLINGDECTDSAIERVFQKCDCYDTIKVRFHIQSHILQKNLQQRFEQLVVFNCKTFPNSKCVSIQISKDITQLQDIAMALFQARYNPQSMCDFLLDNCIEPLIMKPVSVEYIDNEGGDSALLKLSYSLKDLKPNSSLKPSYNHVLEHIKKLLQCLYNINVMVTSTQHVFTIIGNYIKERMLNMLINDCLLNAIPETIEEYQDSSLIEDVHQFEQFLADIFLINLDTDHALTEFTEQYENNYRNRMFKRYLQSAKEVMKKDLQDMVIIAERNTSEDVANNPLLLPRCMISKSAMEFVKLMERILQQSNDANNTNNDESNPSYDIVSMMLDAYMIEVPKIHKTLIESIPQQSALLYNNCMFLVHWIANNLKKSASACPTLVRTLQATGNKYLKTQIEYQQRIIMEILNELDLSDPISLGSMPLKLIRQCLRQLELLKNVWINVLPENIYNKTFCELLNDLCSELIRRILNLEDISTTVATELSDLIDVVLQKVPLLYEEPQEVIHIKTWKKLTQLKMILNASLKEITENWCDGTLTENYKADEVKHLIRALFQNTDRRAKALVQIS